MLTSATAVLWDKVICRNPDFSFKTFVFLEVKLGNMEKREQRQIVTLMCYSGTIGTLTNGTIGLPLVVIWYQ